MFPPGQPETQVSLSLLGHEGLVSHGSMLLPMLSRPPQQRSKNNTRTQLEVQTSIGVKIKIDPFLFSKTSLALLTLLPLLPECCDYRIIPSHPTFKTFYKSAVPGICCHGRKLADGLRSGNGISAVRAHDGTSTQERHRANGVGIKKLVLQRFKNTKTTCRKGDAFCKLHISAADSV